MDDDEIRRRMRALELLHEQVSAGLDLLIDAFDVTLAAIRDRVKALGSLWEPGVPPEPPLRSEWPDSVRRGPDGVRCNGVSLDELFHP